MKRLGVMFLLVMTVVLAGCGGPARSGRDTLYQVSTLDELKAGDYDGRVPVQELRRHGDLGLGTFHGLDGEMVVVDGRCYQVRADGHAYATSGRLKTPFAAVTWFERDFVADCTSALTMAELKELMDSMLVEDDVIHAVRIDGVFDFVKARSVYEQDRPYPPLAKAIHGQEVYTLDSVRGTLIGFRCPDPLRGVNAAGYHLHFINAARTRGGHVLDCRLQKGTVALDHTDRLDVRLGSE
jgi:acetolactate decarboxylase